MAIAPERMGIGIRRHFTTEGIHPYETVEWQRRDARITNYRDGAVAFEQLGVEVPSTWSVNATNILAQKYFRGTLGTPEREWSLKQVADRVADTITAWGLKDGYFVDEQEAAIFSDELKFLIVHQKAAFNSPVWFNIGVADTPQQASACQPYDAMVSTPEGLVPIGRLVEDEAIGTKVYDASGLTRIVAVKANGRKRVLRIQTDGGPSLDVTGDHLVWRATDDDGGGEFVEADALDIGERLSWISTDSGGRDQSLRITEIRSLGEMEVFDIQTESGEYLSGNLRVHNCFILSVDDQMKSILNWYVEEGTIFKGGSGAGTNLSRIRSSVELLEGGGTASGPVSFMRGADASAGTIKSGGKTRRAAKMVILNVDHPDIEDFIWCKALEERKARVLRDAGFDMDLDGKDSHSLQYQNANNSVRVSDEFMQAVVDDGDWELVAVTHDEVVKTVKARELFRQIATAAWECADPGMQFDTTINKWHTAASTGRINASNPCFPGDARVHTDKGLIRFDELIDRARLGETFGVYTHDATNEESPAEQVEITSPEAFMITGFNEIVRLRFDNGMELRCTPNHRVFTVNRGYVEAKDLTGADEVKVLNVPAPAVSADQRLPVSTEPATYFEKGERTSLSMRLPEKWSDEFAHYLGWLVGDGCISGNAVSTIYGSDEDRAAVLPRHADLVSWMNGDRERTPSAQRNGTVQLRQSRRAIARFFEALGVKSEKTPAKEVPWAIEQAPPDAVAAFLRGLFDADGCVYDGETSRYVGLGSASPELLRGVQRLLTTFGVYSRIYQTTEGDEEAFTYVRKDGTFAIYESNAMYDLRIANRSVARFAQSIGFTLPQKARRLERLQRHRFNVCRETSRLIERTDDGIELTYNLSEPRNHSYIVNGQIVRNCSEYMHLDNSACNLASLNLLTFHGEDEVFDVEGFKRAVEVMFTAQEILVGNADYPTEAIAETSRRFRQLGLGYANLGALLMALGMPYDSDGGRALAAAITALMTGHAYATSGRTAARMGPFAGYSENAEHMNRVLAMHRDEVATIDEEAVPTEILSAAQEAWDEAVELGKQYGVRNSQATVLAPTGCLVGGTLVPTERGLVRLRSLGDTEGPQWQPLGIDVNTDEGSRAATKFYVNGLETVVDVETERGYRVQGTAQHRIKTVDPTSGEWVWRRFGDVRPGELVPLALNQLIGEPQPVPLPPAPEAYWTSEHNLDVPRQMTPALAELVGYFMGDGSLHSRGLRFCVTDGDFQVAERLEFLAKQELGLPVHLEQAEGNVVVRVDSVRLTMWWEACGFAKRRPHEGHVGKGYTPHIPDAVLHSNDWSVYAAFLRGLYEADGTVTNGCPTWSSTSIEFSHEVQSLLLALGFPTTRKVETNRTGWGTHPIAVLRLLNLSLGERFNDVIGFIGDRKGLAVQAPTGGQAARKDHIPVQRALVDRLAPVGHSLRPALLLELRRHGGVSRRIAQRLQEETGDCELAHALSFFYDRISSATLGDEEFTYDISVPDNVTYLANGFVSHNTIGLLMDCDTTGIEPDLGLVKMKKLVGGGTMSIVNQTVPRALRRLDFSTEQIDEIIAYIDEHKSILGAPHLTSEHMAVFACSMGDNTIHYLGHVKMMAAVQPWISGAISKTVNMPEDVTIEDVEQLHIDAWQMGVKAIAIYRDNCKVAQPLATAKKGDKAQDAPSGAVSTDTELAKKVAELEKALEIQTVVVKQPVRERLPKRRKGVTFKFRVADCEGYATVSEYEDGRPGEIFLKVSKQGSTLAGIMDAFSISISLGLQHGVPLRTYVEKYSNMRFEPAGMTDDPELRIASSILDYVFRRLAVDYLPFEDRQELGILTTDERMQPTLPGVEEEATESVGVVVPERPATHPKPDVPHSDAPFCMQCGVQMQRAGSCHACPSCGTTSGCS